MTDLVRENVQSYPRPPLLQPVSQRLVIVLDGQVIANTTAGFRVLETHHAPTYYLPTTDVSAALLPAAGGSYCEWKGNARYYDVKAGVVTVRRAAWGYDHPTARFLPLVGHVAFYAALMDEAWVGNSRVIPQAGDFYGGWITSNLEGQIKGAPGTRHW